MNPSNKFKTISQVSKDFDLPTHVLRFWETRFKQLSPLKLSGNRRYYRKSDIELISYIKNLLHTDHISIKGVQKIFGNQTINKILHNNDKIFKKNNKIEKNVPFKGNNNKENLDTKKIISNIVNELKKIKKIL